MNNKFKVCGKTTIIYLKYKDTILKSYIDTGDFAKANSYDLTWHARWSDSANTFYVTTGQKFPGKKKFNIHLHRLLFGLGDDWRRTVVDHKDHNGLNNRRSNLTVMPKSANHRLIRKTRSTSGYQGVTRNKRHGKDNWIANLCFDNACISLGQYADVHEAGRIAKAARDFVIGLEMSGVKIEPKNAEFKKLIRKTVGYIPSIKKHKPDGSWLAVPDPDYL